jgi:hypothetical protein
MENALVPSGRERVPVKLWSEFYDLVAPHLPGCPFAAMDNALRQAAIVFCEQSLAWRFDHPAIAIEPGVSVYPFALPAESALHAILHAVLDGRKIACFAAGRDMEERNRAINLLQGVPSCIFGSADSFTLAPEPTASGVLILRVVLKPSLASTGLGDREFDEYREAIAHGALFRLMSSPKKPYTQLQLASTHQEQFGIKTGAAAMNAERSYIRLPLRTQIRDRA